MSAPEPLKDSENAVRPVRRTSVCDEIITQILDLIARNVLHPGDRLPTERELCKRFGVGRSSLREALRSLVTMGILDSRVGEGTFVCDNSQFLQKALQWGLLLDRKKVQDLLETRLMLESENAFWAAQRAKDEDLNAVEEALAAMRLGLGDREVFLAADLRFHLLIAQATQNSILASLLEATRGYLQEWIERSLTSRAEVRSRRSLEEHARIVEALRGGDGERARTAMVAHIQSSSEDLLELVEG
jgi:GntR family transcriptional repressor for pyruvate dehydrogenase complex